MTKYYKDLATIYSIVLMIRARSKMNVFDENCGREYFVLRMCTAKLRKEYGRHHIRSVSNTHIRGRFTLVFRKKTYVSYVRRRRCDTDHGSTEQINGGGTHRLRRPSLPAFYECMRGRLGYRRLRSCGYIFLAAVEPKNGVP